MYIFLAILLISFLIFIHELGHFVAAKLSGVQVNEFSLFMGPAIFQKQIGQTLYSLRCIPLGGYCAMEGENGESDNPHSFFAAAWWKKLIILLAGVTMNFLVGVVLMMLVLGFSPSKLYVEPVISGFQEGSTLIGEDRIQVGDRIVKIDGDPMYLQSDFELLLMLNPGDYHDITVERDGQKVELSQVPVIRQEFLQEDGTTRMMYGITFSVTELNFGSVVRQGWLESVDSIRLAWVSLKMLFTGKAGMQDMSGPVAIVAQINNTAKASGSLRMALLNIGYYGGFFALNLAVMNLLPIPALDGGRAFCLLLTTVVEAVTRKKVDPKYEAYLNAAGMVLLLGLMLVISLKDVISIVF